MNNKQHLKTCNNFYQKSPNPIDTNKITKKSILVLPKYHHSFYPHRNQSIHQDILQYQEDKSLEVSISFVLSQVQWDKILLLLNSVAYYPINEHSKFKNSLIILVLLILFRL